MMDKRIQIVAGALARMKAVLGVICFGSHALGREDEHSDADLYVFTAGRIPSKASRRHILEAIPGASRLRLDCPGNDRQWWPMEDKFLLRGLKFEIHYSRFDRIAGIVRKVQQGRLSLPELRFRAHTMPGLLANSVVLHDADGLVARLLRCLYPYPGKLRRALTRSSLAKLQRLLGDLRNTAERGFGASAFLFSLALCKASIKFESISLGSRYAQIETSRRPQYSKVKSCQILPSCVRKYSTSSGRLSPGSGCMTPTFTPVEYS